MADDHVGDTQELANGKARIIWQISPEVTMRLLFQVCAQGPSAFHLENEVRRFRQNLDFCDLSGLEYGYIVDHNSRKLPKLWPKRKSTTSLASRVCFWAVTLNNLP